MATQSQNKGTELEKKLVDIQAKRVEEDAMSLAQRIGLPFSDLKSAPIDIDALTLIDEETARKSQVAAIIKNGVNLTVITLNPEDGETAKTLKALGDKGFKVSIIIVSSATLEKVLARYKTAKAPDVFKIGAIEIKEETLKEYESQIKDLADIKNKVTRISATEMLEILIAGALRLEASDIHFEPEAQETRLRYRLDGVLNDVTAIDKDSYARTLNRIKVLSKLKLNIHSSPQDGRFTIKETSIDIEVRVSVLPSEFGETVVMRLLDPRTIKAKLEDLGMREDLLKTVQEQLEKSTGAILTTGPTGSGKTTTLYAFIQHLNSPGTKIITIEDPIEYHITGISQTQVDSKKGYTFANGLRAIVRQDPDIILVGEIRDLETADIALQAALTGHLVLSTIHTNDAAGTIPRLIDLGIQPQIIAPAINMAMAQRLVRKLCQKCKIEDRLEPEMLEELKKQLEPIQSKYKLPKLDGSLKVYFPGKCKECNETGYKGRVGVYEAFIITKEMERLILKTPAISDIRDLAVSQGMITMLQDAYMKLLEGVTSVEEIKRILG
ncbi:MAG: type II/IV secretion system protein [Candidatus Yanofskybacteria bacterium]|nr:type II/IV secretion system protein [Candidatus Yanofskybacteria bacterium]